MSHALNEKWIIKILVEIPTLWLNNAVSLLLVFKQNSQMYMQGNFVNACKEKTFYSTSKFNGFSVKEQSPIVNYLRVGWKVPRPYSMFPQNYHFNIFHPRNNIIIMYSHRSCLPRTTRWQGRSFCCFLEWRRAIKKELDLRSKIMMMKKWNTYLIFLRTGSQFFSSGYFLMLLHLRKCRIYYRYIGISFKSDRRCRSTRRDANTNLGSFWCAKTCNASRWTIFSRVLNFSRIKSVFGHPLI